MANLYCTPLGHVPHNLFCGELETLPHDESLLVLPSQLLIDRVRKQHFVACATMESLAMKLLNLNGYSSLQEISRNGQELIIGELLDEIAESGRMGYFRTLSGKKGYIKAVTSLVGELSRSGTDERELSSALGAWQGRSDTERDKDIDIALLYTLYRGRLKDRGFFDLEGKYRLALHVLADAEATVPWKKVCFSDFYTFDKLQLAFIRELAKRCDVSVGVMYERKRTALAGATGRTVGDLSSFCRVEYRNVEQGVPYESDSGDLQYLTQVWGWAGQDISDSSSDRQKLEEIRKTVQKHLAGGGGAPNVELICCNSRESEMRRVLTKVKELLLQGSDTSQIMLAVRSLRNYSGLRNLADEYGIPVTLNSTAALLLQPLTALLLDMLESADNDRRGAEAYFRVLTSPAGKFLYEEDCRNSRELCREKYFLFTQAVRDSLSQLKAGHNSSSESQGISFAFVDEFIKNLPRQGSIEIYADLLTEFLDSMRLEKRLGAQYRNKVIDVFGLKLVLQSKELLQSSLARLKQDYNSCGQGNKSFSCREFAQLLREAVEDVEIVLSRGHQNGVLIAEVANAQGLEYPYIFVLGVREGEFPYVETENWIYSDAERRIMKHDMGIDMQLTADSLAVDEYFFSGIISQARKKIFISFFEEDNIGGSQYISRLQNLCGDLMLDECGINDKIPCSTEEAVRRGALRREWLVKKLGSPTNLLLEAAEIDNIRSSLPAANGMIGENMLLEEIRTSTEHGFSPSQLETYARCPFKYLAERIWRQEEFSEAPEELELDVRGTIVHASLQKHFDSCCEKYVREEVRKSVFWPYEKASAWKLLFNWLEYEYSERSVWNDYVPWRTECEFGFQKENNLQLQLTDGSFVSLNGKIDRIDKNGDKLFITDYKTGRCPEKGALAKGLDLQLPVYMLAASQMGGVIAGGGYLSLKDKKRINTIAFTDLGNHDFKLEKTSFRESEDKWADMKSFSENVLKDYVQRIRKGDFSPAPVDCRYCAVAGICRYQDTFGGGED